MLGGTEREVLDLLVGQPRSPTEVAQELGVSVQTASRNLKNLVEAGYAEEDRSGRRDHREQNRRGYKQFRAKEFAQVFAGFDGELFEETFEITPEKRSILSVWKVPQTEFHPFLFAYLAKQDWDRKLFDVTGIVLYGSVARGTAQKDSDIDLLLVYEPSGESEEEPQPASFAIEPGFVRHFEKRIVSEEWFTVSEFHDGLDAGSQFLRNVLEEGIVLYDPEGVIRDARQEQASERVPQ